MPTVGQILRERTQALTGSLSAHRIFLYAVFSFFAVSVTIANALRNYSNFYSVAIYLSKSSRSVLVLANFGFLVALLAGHVAQKIFFGPLRPSEIERLYDRLWFFITESLLAFTIFRDEFDVTFVIMFGFLLFVKSFHWIAADRIEWMDQRPYPGPSLLFHVRMTALFIILWATDLLLFMIAVDSTVSNGVGGMIFMGFFMATVTNTVSKYLLCAYELRRAGLRGGENAPPWENKSMWVFYIELATDFLKLSTYLVFFIIIMTFYGVPLNILRDVYVTGRSLITRLRSLHRYQTATRNMDERYPNATEEEMTAMSDHTCIICREEMVLPRPLEAGEEVPVNVEGPNTTPKKLPCGHIFHFNCLRSWLERQQSCPTCRRNVLEVAPQPAAPQPQLPGAAGQAQNPPGPGVQNPGANNPLGFVGRLFAPPGQQGPGQPQAGHPGIVIEYHIQYQLPRPPAQQPPALQPMQQFQGIPGPAGVWQPWPQAAPGGGNDAPAAPDNFAPDPIPTPTVVQPEAQVPVPDAQPAPADSSPRAAAALAALRRLNGGRPSDHRPAPTPTTPSSPTPSSQSTEGVPPNIPKFWAVNRSRRTRDLFPVPVFRHKQRRLLQHKLLLSDPVKAHKDPQSDSRYQPRPPISQLPPTLTDEQLALMDSVTRDAIDERLRVLEGVSGAVYRCIDDLMRMRSALPVSTPVQQTSTPGTPVASTSAPTQPSAADDAAGAAAVAIPESPAAGPADLPPEA
ncbi:hypothetical protein C8J57DRAFT_1430947 [Mycena rebaudengoi]|nr:hypothetical protein C8J57DRAFT_1430947 [Mycena rebaudengoi]